MRKLRKQSHEHKIEQRLLQVAEIHCKVSLRATSVGYPALQSLFGSVCSCLTSESFWA
jgi:hypothetical protein